MTLPSDPALSPEDRDALAGEYVLGLIEGADLTHFVARLDRDAALAASVETWRRHFAAIDASVTPQPPSPALWPRIEQSLTGQVQAVQTAAARTIVRPSEPGAVTRWWRSLFVWRGLAFAGALATIALAVGLVGALDRARRQPAMVAVLMTETNTVAAVVNTFSDGRVELVPLQNIAVPEGKALEVWTLWDRAIGPRSVGVTQQARSTPLRLDQLPLGKDQLFEITIEAATGSPTGKPTGPVVAKGTTAQAL